MPYLLKACIFLGGKRYPVEGVIRDFKPTADGIEVNGINIFRGDIESGPTHTVRANLKDYINFRGIEMDMFNKDAVDPAAHEYAQIAKNIRLKLHKRLLDITHEYDANVLVNYYDMQIVIDQYCTDRIRNIQKLYERIVRDHKLIIVSLRSDKHAKRNRPRVIRQAAYSS